MQSKLPVLTLCLTILFLVSAVVTLIIGSNNSSIYNQMKKSPIARSKKEIKKLNGDGFIISGFLKEERTSNSLKNIEIVLNDTDVKIEDGFSYYMETEKPDKLREGTPISIYSAINIVDGKEVINGYELYPGTPEQYINYLSSPFNSYMVYVRVLIGLSIVFFLFSIVLNIRK